MSFGMTRYIRTTSVLGTRYRRSAAGRGRTALSSSAPAAGCADRSGTAADRQAPLAAMTSAPKPSEASLRRDLNAIKGDAFPWIGEVTKNAPQQAIKNLGVAFKNFFDGRAKYPTFKKKGVSSDSFRADNGTDKQHRNAVEVDGRRVKLPVIGWIRMRESVRFTGNIKSVTVSRVADRWFASFTVEIGHPAPVRETQAAVGVDLWREGAGNAERRQCVRRAEGAAEQPEATPEAIPRSEPKGPWLGQLRQGTQEDRPAARADRQHPAGLAAQPHIPHHQPILGDRDRGSECARHDGEPEPGPVNRRCRHVRVSPAARIQGGDARLHDRRRGSVVPVQQDVLGPQARSCRPRPVRSGLVVRRVRRGPRSGPQRGDQFRGHGRQFGGVSLWSGRRWRSA
jgi:hypothetical protein